MMKGWAFSPSHADFLQSFFLFWTMDHRTRLVPIATTIDGPSALDLANARKSSFHSSFRHTTWSPKCFAQTGDRHSCQASNTGSALEKRKEISKKILVVVVGVRKKMPGGGAEFSKRPPEHRRSQKPQSLNIWRQIFQKRGKQKKLFETDITLERKEMISSFERKSSLESFALNVPEWPSPSHARNLSFTHDGYIRHTATEMIILMTDISVIWHSTG